MNFVELMCRQGVYQHCPRMPATLGLEGAGVVVQVGKDVTQFKVSVSVSFYPCVSVSVSLSVCLFLCLPALLESQSFSLSLSICPPLFLHFSLSLPVSLLFVCLSYCVRHSIYGSVYICFCLYQCLCLSGARASARSGPGRQGRGLWQHLCSCVITHDSGQ